MKTVCIYARVSTTGQSVENQLAELRQVACNHNWVIAHEYVDHGLSGAKGRDKRPHFDQLLKAVTRRDVDLVMAWSVDRLGRSLQDLIGFLNELQSKQVDLYLHQQGIDTTTPAGKALFQMLGVFAEFERAMIQERVRAGLQRARAEGKTLGRPRIKPAVRDKIHLLRKRGLSLQAIADQAGVGRMTVYRELKQSQG